MRVLILTAGFGTRLKPHTDHIAKPAIPFLGTPGLGYMLFLAETLKPQKIGFNTHYLPKTIITAVENLKGPGYELFFSEEKPQILNSGGGIKNAERDLKGDGSFVVMNGDTVLIPASISVVQDLVDFHNHHQPIATLLVKRFKDAGNTHGGVFTNLDKKTVSHFAKTRTTEKSEPWHFTGIAVYSDKVFDFLPSNSPTNIFYDGLTAAMAGGETVLVYDASDTLWFETGNEKDFFESEQTLIKEVQNETTYGETLIKILERYHGPKQPNEWLLFLKSNSGILP